jgi:hypothetical protein
MTADQNKILARIRKMMALADCNAATEGERDTALKMAYNLLAKHNLSMVDVENKAAEGEAREGTEASFVVYPWARNIASAVANMFFCNYYFMRSHTGKQATHVFVGKQSNAVTASYMADFVVRSVLREATKRYKSAISPEARTFAVGVVHKLRARIEEIKKAQATAPADAEGAAMTAGSALVLADLYKREGEANKLWLAAQGVELKTTTSRQKSITDSSAYNAGKAFGGTVSLAPQVGGKANSTVKAIK